MRLLRYSFAILALLVLQPALSAAGPEATDKAHAAAIAKAEASGIKSLELTNIASDFAIDSASGTVATVSPTHPIVRIYPKRTDSRDISAALSVKVGNAPC